MGEQGCATKVTSRGGTRANSRGVAPPNLEAAKGVPSVPRQEGQMGRQRDFQRKEGLCLGRVAGGHGRTGPESEAYA